MLRASVIPLLFGSPAASIGAAAARNTFDYFTKAPTFDPPADCKPTETNYGVLAQCETEFSKEHYFWASMDTAVGWFQEESPKEHGRTIPLADFALSEATHHARVCCGVRKKASDSRLGLGLRSSFLSFRVEPPDRRIECNVER